MAITPSKTIAALSQIKLPPVKIAPKAAPTPPPPPPKPSTIVTTGQVKPNLGLYVAPKVTSQPAPPLQPKVASQPAPSNVKAQPAPAPKPEVLATNANGVVAGKGRVVLDIEASDSGYANRIYYSIDNFKTKQYVGIDNQTRTVDLGTFKPGTTVQFGIDNGQGDFFKTGGAAANADKVDHTKISKLADGGVRVGFEDLRGGGDRDFNDAIIKVRSVALGAPLAPPAPAPGGVQGVPGTPPANASNGNRSGLGDGTNPGQGAGTVKSPNQGTLNPGGIR